MALSLTMPPPRRQPFANLDSDSPRLKSLMRSKLNIQNQQNSPGLLSTPDSDIENIDPNTLTQSTKRKREAEEPSSKPVKTSRIALSVDTTTTTTTTPPTVSSSFLLPPQPSTPKSAPVPVPTPAGRSPQSKSHSRGQRKSYTPFSSRTITKSRSDGKGKQKQNQKGKGKSVSRPFSLATALSSSSSTTPTSTSISISPSKSAPRSWFFDIYTDSHDEELTNLMQHSTCVLDISDDEGRGNAKSGDGDGRGKENIPPVPLPIPGVGVGSGSGSGSGRESREGRKSVDERAPLGELNATEFYGEGCHAFSVEVVYDDDCDKERKEKEKEEKRNEGEERAVSIDGILAMENTCSKEEKEKDENENENRFEIWESGSAHGESI